jgi:crotonobetaine/carnitine-CoA ligase
VTQVFTELNPTFSDPNEWTLSHVLRFRTSQTPDKMFLDVPDEGLKFSYSEMLDQSKRVATGIAQAGGVAGDRVLIMGINSSQYVRSWFGCAVGGYVEVPINNMYEGEFLRHQVATVKSRFAIVDDDLVPRYVAIADQIREIEKFWVVDRGQGHAAIDALKQAGWDAELWSAFESTEPTDFPIPSPRELGAIFFTSGTTGPSKGVAMPFSQLYFFADEVVNFTRLTSADTYMTTTPLFHGNAQFMASYPALIAGGSLVVRPKFSASRWSDWLREGNVTATNLVGVMSDFVWKAEPKSTDADNPLRVVYAAPMPKSIRPGFKQRFGVEAVVDAFGLTETCAPIMSPYNDDLRPDGASGLLASDWFEIRLVDPETDLEVATGQVGELTIRYKQPWTCSMGYYGMPEKTVEAWRNLWFHTGDALKQDNEGWFYFVDRYKDALRRRGENISSFEVEMGLLQHPAVLEAAVIGVDADQEGGENEVMAILVTTETVDPIDLWAFCDGLIPTFAQPRYLRFMDALPKTPSEKVQKAELRKSGVTADTFDRTKLTDMRA